MGSDIGDGGPSPVELAQAAYERAKQKMEAAHVNLGQALHSVAAEFERLAAEWEQTSPGELPPRVSQLAGPVVQAHQVYDEAWDETTEAARELGNARRGHQVRRDQPVST